MYMYSVYLLYLLSTNVYVHIHMYMYVQCTNYYHMFLDLTMYMKVQSLAWMGPNQHLLAPQTHNPFFPSD